MSVTVIDITPAVTVIEVPFVIVPGGVPENVEAPALIANDPPRVGDRIGIWPGVWSQLVTGYTLQLTRDGVDIPGASEDGYTVVDDDFGTDLALRVVASNAAGDSDPATSASIGPVAAAAAGEPVTVAAPTWSAVWQSSQVATIVPGTYTGTEPIAIARSVEFGPDGVSWPSDVPIAGTTTFLVYSAGLFEFARVKEIASNDEGSVTAYSSVQQLYPAGALPIATTAPDTTVNGATVPGTVIGTCGAVWDGQGAEITGFEYQYLRDGSPIAGETDPTYTLVEADRGTTILPESRGVSSVGTGAWVSADAIDVPAPAVETGRIYPAALTLYATEDTDGSSLVGTPTQYPDGSIEVIIAPGAAHSGNDGVHFMLTLKRDSAGTSWPEDCAEAGRFPAGWTAYMEPVAGSGTLDADVPAGLAVSAGLLTSSTANPTSISGGNPNVGAGVRMRSGSPDTAEGYLLIGSTRRTTDTADASEAAGTILGMGTRYDGVNAHRTEFYRGGAALVGTDGVALEAMAFNDDTDILPYVVALISVQRSETTTANITARFKPSFDVYLAPRLGDPA